MKTKLTLAILALAASAFAADTILPMSGRIQEKRKPVEMDAALVPATDTDVATVNTWPELITLSNITSSAVTCTVLDKQTTPRAIVKDVSIGANAAVVISTPGGRKFKGGISWSCSSGTAVIGYIRGFQE